MCSHCIERTFILKAYWNGIHLVRLILAGRPESSLKPSFCPKGLLCGRVSKNHVCPSVCISVRRRRPCVAIKNDQVLNGKSSLSKVSSSKRDPKRDHLQDLIARFSDVEEICGVGIIDDLGDVLSPVSETGSKKEN